MNRLEFQGRIEQLLEEANFYDIEFTGGWGNWIKIELDDANGTSYAIGIKYDIKDDNITVTNIYYPYLKDNLNYIINKIKGWKEKGKLSNNRPLAKLDLYIKCRTEFNKINNEVLGLDDIANAFKNDKELDYIYNMLIEYKKKVGVVIEKLDKLLDQATTIWEGE